MAFLIWLTSIVVRLSSRAGKRGIVALAETRTPSFAVAGSRCDLLDDQLRAFDASPFVNVQTVGQLHDAPARRFRLVESNRINGDRPIGRPDFQFEMMLADDACLDDVEQAVPGRLRKTRTPRTPVP